MRKLVIILCAPIDNLNMQEALARIEEFVLAGRKTGKTHQVATVNADFVVKALSDPELRFLLQDADMATADGMPLVWGARLLGTPIRTRVAGADMIPALAELAAQKSYSMFFLGAAPGVAARAADILQEKYPELKIAGVITPPLTSVLEMDPSIIAEIKKASPDILLVAFGNPKQEKWIGMYRRDLGVPVMIGVGGTFDFIAGETIRAPLWIQNIGFEWLFRLLQEPRRLWKRYVIDIFAFGSFFLRQWWIMRQKPVPSPLLPEADVIVIGKTAVIKIVGRVDFRNSNTITQQGLQALEITPNVIVDLSRIDFLDSTGIGSLVGLAKRARDAGGELKLATVPDSVMKVLTMLRLDQYFQFIKRLEDGLGLSYTTTTTHEKRIGKWHIYRVPRRFDAETAPSVTRACSELLGQNSYVIMDFSDTVFLGSAGLATLLNLNRLALQQEVNFRLACCSEDVKQVIKMVRFDKVLSIFRDVDAAVTNKA